MQARTRDVTLRRLRRILLRPKLEPDQVNHIFGVGQVVDGPFLAGRIELAKDSRAKTGNPDHPIGSHMQPARAAEGRIPFFHVSVRSLRVDAADPVPLVRLEDKLFVSELYHGPTRAFKDMALQPFGLILSELAQQQGQQYLQTF